MNKEFEFVFERLDKSSVALLKELDALLHESLAVQPSEKVWSKMPMYYIGERSIILAPFKGHVNIVSNAETSRKAMGLPNAILAHRDELTEYKITPKGMLQIFCGQTVPKAQLSMIFRETFGQN